MSEPESRVRAFSHPVTALVTGASAGIGLAMVELLVCDPGVRRVVAASRSGRCPVSPPPGGGVQLDGLAMDVTDEASVAQAAQAFARNGGDLDLVVNCAGVLHDAQGLFPERRLADVDPVNIARSFAVNATGPLLVAKHFAHLLPTRDRAVFASLSARVGSIGDNRLGGWYGYRASKAAQNMFTRSLSVELRRRHRGIVCVALHPGTVDTRLSQPFQDRVPPDRLFTPERAAGQLLEVLDGLGPQDNGSFLAWDGKPIPW